MDMQWDMSACRIPRDASTSRRIHDYGGPIVIEVCELTDEALLDGLQRAAFDYFLGAVNPTNGLVADNSRENSPCSIAVVGFPVELSGRRGARLDGARRRGQTQSFGAAFLPRQRSKRQRGRDRLQGFLLPLSRCAHGYPRLALRIVDDRHGAFDRRCADCEYVLYREYARGNRAARTRRGALPSRRLALVAG